MGQVRATVLLLATGVLMGGVLAGGAAAQERQTDAVRRESDRVQFASYPAGALRRGEQGVVGIRVSTDAQGRLRACEVSRSSGFPDLDEASCDMLLQHLRMRPYLAPDGAGVVQRQEGQVVWKLPAGRVGPVATANAALQGKAAGERRICHVQVNTGSLVASRRTCLTRREWQLQYEFAQRELRDMHSGFQPGDVARPATQTQQPGTDPF